MAAGRRAPHKIGSSSCNLHDVTFIRCSRYDVPHFRWILTRGQCTGEMRAWGKLDRVEGGGDAIEGWAHYRFGDHVSNII